MAWSWEGEKLHLWMKIENVIIIWIIKWNTSSSSLSEVCRLLGVTRETFLGDLGDWSFFFRNNTKALFIFFILLTFAVVLPKYQWVNCWLIAWIKAVKPSCTSSHCILHYCPLAPNPKNASSESSFLPLLLWLKYFLQLDLAFLVTCLTTPLFSLSHDLGSPWYKSSSLLLRMFLWWPFYFQLPSTTS